MLLDFGCFLGLCFHTARRAYFYVGSGSALFPFSAFSSLHVSNVNFTFQNWCHYSFKQIDKLINTTTDAFFPCMPQGEGKLAQAHLVSKQILLLYQDNFLDFFFQICLCLKVMGYFQSLL